MSGLLEVRDLVRHFPSHSGGGWPRSGSQRKGNTVRAVDGVSFEIRPRESFGLVGESGCGKTTLASCLLRLLEPDSGQIRFRGEDWLALQGRALRRERRRIQAVFQDPYTSLNPRLRVGEIIREPLRVHRQGGRKEQKQRVVALLERVGLAAEDARRRPSEFSGGQRQRIAIARALALGPDLLVADEPVSSLDVSVQAQILNLFRRLREELGLTILLISHELPVVRYFCERTAVMWKGRLVELAATNTLFTSPRHPYTRRLLEAIPEPDPSRRKNPGRVPLVDGTEIPPLREVAPGHWVAL